MKSGISLNCMKDTRKLVASRSTRPNATLRVSFRNEDYKRTFSPVSKKDSLRIIITLVAHYDLELHQMDVKTVFLNGSLEEEVYMDQ